MYYERPKKTIGKGRKVFSERNLEDVMRANTNAMEKAHRQEEKEKTKLLRDFEKKYGFQLGRSGLLGIQFAE